MTSCQRLYGYHFHETQPGKKGIQGRLDGGEYSVTWRIENGEFKFNFEL